jgi:hypothetical protein
MELFVSIDLFCYTPEPPEVTREKIKLMSLDYPEFFQNKFFIFDTAAVRENQRLIVLEHGMITKSIFLIHLNEKMSANLVTEVAEALRNTFGKENILVLHNNDEPI